MAKKVLIIEDEVDLSFLMRKRLEANGFTVLATEDGMEGLNLARKEKPDIIVLDLMLPKVDGLKICRLLKFDQSLKRIPILVVTAKAQSEDRLMALEAGADSFLLKPFSMNNLQETLETLLAKVSGSGTPSSS